MPANSTSTPDQIGPSGLTILITGVSGLIGLPLAVALAKRNRVIGAAPGFGNPSDKELLKKAGVETLFFDASDPDLSRLPSRADVVYHFGAIVGKPAEIPENREKVYSANAYSCARLMSRYRDCKAFIFSSSGSTYAYQGQRPLREDDIFGFHTGFPVYAATKVGAEFIIQALSREWGIPSVILRIFSPYGIRGGGIAMRVDQVRAGLTVELYPDGPNRYCPIFEDDCARKAIAAVGIAKSPPEIVNFSGTTTISVEEYCTIAGRMLGKEPVFVRNSAFYPIWPDMTKCNALLGPDTVSVEEGIRRVVEAGPGARLPSWSASLHF